MAQLVFEFLTLTMLAGCIAALGIRSVGSRRKAHSYAVTLKDNEGAFVGLCVKKRWDIWTFVNVQIVPTNPGAAYQQAAPGELYVPHRNILYYQEIANVAE